MFLRGADTVLEPRKRWPAGLAGGRKGAIVGATDGRALTYADTPGWLERRSPPSTRPTHRCPTTWSTAWSRCSPAGSSRGTTRPGRGRAHAVAPAPVLVRDLAERIAAVGKLALVDALTVSGPRPPDDVPSGPRVEALFAIARG